MGSTATGTVAYGINLGIGSESFDLPEDEWGNPVDLPAPYDEDLDLYKLIKESGIAGLDADSYGYDFEGSVVMVRGTVQTVYWDCEPLEAYSSQTDYVWADRIQQFVEFLDSKGLILKSEYRQPKWLLYATYG